MVALVSSIPGEIGVSIEYPWRRVSLLFIFVWRWLFAMSK
jgi:hypothetical protein